MISSAPRIFIAYAKEDIDIVNEIYNKLKSEGFNPWMDKKDLQPGQIWKDAIENAIGESDFFIACLSTNSVTKRGFVQREYRIALDLYSERPHGDIFLIPLRLDDCRIPDLRVGTIKLIDFQWTNMTDFDKIVSMIRETHPKNSDRSPMLERIEEQYVLSLFNRLFADWKMNNALAEDYQLDLFAKYVKKLNVSFDEAHFLIESALERENDHQVWLNLLAAEEQWRLIIKMIEAHPKPNLLVLLQDGKFRDRMDFLAVVKRYIEHVPDDRVLDLPYLTMDQQWELVKYILTYVHMRKKNTFNMLMDGRFAVKPDYISVLNNVLIKTNDRDVLVAVISQMSCFDDEQIFDAIKYVFSKFTTITGDKPLDCNDKVISAIFSWLERRGKNDGLLLLLDYYNIKHAYYDDGDNHHQALDIIAKLGDRSAITRLEDILNEEYYGNDGIITRYLDHVKETIDRLKNT